MMLEAKTVPADLFPVKDIDINEAWAARTIQYRSAFKPEEQIAVATQTHLQEWIKEATALCNELRILGTVKAEEHIIYLCNNVYRIEPPGDVKTFANMYQVSSKMMDREFFKKEYNKYLDLLHMFQYGIFRCQFNAWAQDASNEWMTKKNITYGDKTNTIKKLQKRGKGFVYKLLVNRASNTVCVRFQNLTQRMFGEYIIVRDKKNRKTAFSENIVEHVFNNNYRGYIVRFGNENAFESKSLKKEEKEKIEKYALKAVQIGIPVENIFRMFDQLIQSQLKGMKTRFVDYLSNFISKN